MTKHLLALAATALLAPSAWAAGEYTDWFGGGTGTADDPYQVYSMLHLSNLAVQNYWNTDFAGTYFVMTADIDFALTADMMWGIGLGNRQFQGTFDAQGHALRGIVLRNVANGGPMFSWVGPQGTVRNLTIADADFSGTQYANNTALLAGNVSGLIENCHVTGAVQNYDATVVNNFNGGLVAYLTGSGRIADCTYDGSVSAACGFGAIVGRNMGGRVSDCTSTARITVTRAGTTVGGVNGTTQWMNGGAEVNYERCRFAGTITQAGQLNGTNAGGIFGNGWPVVAVACINEGTITSTGYTGGIGGAVSGTATELRECVNMGLIQDPFMARDSVDASFGMSDYVAGIAGNLYGGTLTRCYNGGTLRSMRCAGGLVGSTGNSGGATAITDCYNAGLIDAPYVWKQSATLPPMQKAGGLVAELGGVYGLTLTRCLSLGTVHNAVAGRYADCEYLGYTQSPDRLTIVDCYHDAQVAGDNSTLGALSTAQLTAGEPLDGFDTGVWTFAGGLYPRLSCNATDAAAVLCATPYLLAGSERHDRVKNDFTLGQGPIWSLSATAAAALNGNTVTVTRLEQPQPVLITATADGLRHQSLVTVYPDAFAGDGTATDPYLINDYDDLVRLSAATTTGGMTFDGEVLRLTADIDLVGGVLRFATDEGTPFLGTLDGGGHTLTGLVMRNDLTATQYGALFGYIGTTGVVRNLTIGEDADLGLYLNGGTIAANLEGAVENVRVLPRVIHSAQNAGKFGGIAGTVATTGRVADCYVGAEIALTGTADHVGGIAAYNRGTIEGCQFAGNVGGTAATYVGGIASENYGTIDDCLAAGYVTANAYAGAVASRDFNGALTRHTLATGQVTYATLVDCTGAVVGQSSGAYDGVWYDRQMGVFDHITAPGLEAHDTQEILTDWSGSRWTTDGSHYPQLTRFAAEPVARLYALPITFATGESRADLLTTAAVATEGGITATLDDGDDFTLAGGTLRAAVRDSYCHDELIHRLVGTAAPVRRTLVGAYGRQMAAGSGTEADPWLIATEADLVKLARQSNAVPTMAHYTGKHFSLAADITLTAAFAGIDASVNGTTASASPRWFRGTIDGNGHSIDNLNITSTNANGLVGLIGYLGPDGTLTGLTIGSGSVQGTKFVGAAVGKCAGTATDVVNRAAVTSTTGNASAGSGGVVGYVTATGRIARLTNHGTVRNTMASGICYTGGVVGYITGNATDTVSGLTNYGTVSGPMGIGGVASTSRGVNLADVANYGTVTGTAATSNLNGGCFADLISTPAVTRAANYGVVTGSSGVGGIAGRNSTLAGQTHRATRYLHCLNAGTVTAATGNAGGIVGMSDTTRIHLLACANVADITCTATTVAAGTPAAGGLVGGGSPVIEDCYNAGTVSGVNCIGGLLGRPVSNGAMVDIINSVNAGWLEGYATNAANVGTVVGYHSSAATYSGTLYDAQLSPVPAAGRADVDGITALSTRSLAGADAPLGDAWLLAPQRYPVPAALAADSAVAITRLPVLLADGDTRLAVTTAFAVATDADYQWTADSVFTINGTRVAIAPSTHGDYAITVAAGAHSRTFPLTVDFTGLRGDVNADGEVDVDDVNILINIILGIDDADLYDGRAYVTDDDDIDIADVNTVINILLGLE